MLSPPTTREEGAALMAAIALMVLGAFVVIAVIGSARGTQGLSRDRLEASASEQLARDAGAVLAVAYSTLASGEHDGFVPSRQVLDAHAARIGGRVVANSAATRVDPRVPARGQFTVEQSLLDGRTGHWQVYSVRLPTWGTTRGGRVQVYVRTWTSAGGRATQPMIYRLEFRPTWFADYQMLFDGKQRISDGAVITGRVHSNGYDVSYYDVLRTQGAQIQFEGSARCTASARISTALGAIAAPGCAARPDTGVRYNFLRARDAADRLRWLCARPAERPSLQMACPPGTETARVRLSGSSVSVNGTTLDARVHGDRPGHNQGAVVLVEGDVEVSGILGAGARALVVAAPSTTSRSYGGSGDQSNGASSGYVVGDVGAADRTPTSSFGLVAAGDIIFDETRISGATARGAFLTMSGMVSSNPMWRTQAPTGGGRMGGTVNIVGSIAGHFPPALINQGNGAGFARRNYVWLDSLYDNPPPAYPTAADWEVTRMDPANLDCFARGAGGSLLDTPECR